MAKDYGFRISKDGSDVKTCDDKDCVLTSKYNTLKGSLVGSGAINNLANGASTIITIAHNLGYVPFVKTFINPTDSEDFANVFYTLPVWVDDVIDHLYSRVYATTSNIYIYVEQWNGSDAARDYNYKYFIFLDKAKL